MHDGDWTATLFGNWVGTVKTWLDPDAPPLENAITAAFRGAFDGPTTIHEYCSHVDDKRSDGMMVLGVDIETNQPCLTWIDTFHTGSNVMLFHAIAGSGELSFAGAYAGGPEIWRWRITFRLTSKDELAIDHVNITPDGQEARAIEVRYRRTA